MKLYIKPTLECIEIRTEERLAGSCVGSCDANTPAGNWWLSPGPDQ